MVSRILTQIYLNSGCYQLTDNGELILDEQGNPITTNETKSKNLYNYLVQIKASAAKLLEYSKYGKDYNDNKIANKKYERYARYAYLFDSSAELTNLSNLNLSDTEGSNKIFSTASSKVKNAILSFIQIGNELYLNSSFSGFTVDENSAFKDWLQYSPSEIIDMEANGVAIPSEVLDWAHTMEANDTTIVITSNDCIEGDNSGQGELAEMKIKTQKLSEQSKAMQEETELKEVEFKELAEEVQETKDKLDNSSSLTDAQSTADELEDLINSMDDLAEDVDEGIELGNDTKAAAIELAYFECGYKRETADTPNTSLTLVPTTNLINSLLYNAKGEEIAVEALRNGNNLIEFSNALSNTLALNEYVTLYDFATENLESLQEVAKAEQTGNEAIKGGDEDGETEEKTPDDFSEYELTAKGIIPRVIEAGKKSEQMGKEALKEAEAASKEIEKLEDKKEEKIIEAENEATEIPENTENEEEAEEGQEEVTENANTKTEQINNDINAQQAEGLKGVERFEKYHEINKKYIDVNNNASNILNLNGLMGMGAIGIGTYMDVTGCSMIIAGNALITAGEALVASIFGSAAGAAMIAEGIALVTNGTGLSITGTACIAYGGGMIATTEIGLEETVKTAEKIDVSEMNIDDAIAILEEKDPDEGLSEAEKERKKLQNEGMSLPEQAKYFTTKSVKTGSDALKDNFKVAGALAQSEKEAIKAKAIAKITKLTLSKKRERYNDLEEKKELSDQKMEEFLANPDTKLNYNELFTEKDQAEMDAIKTTLTEKGTKAQNKLYDSLVTIDGLAEFLAGREEVALLAEDYGLVTQVIGNDLLEKTRGSIFLIYYILLAFAALTTGKFAEVTGNTLEEFSKYTAGINNTNRGTVEDAQSDVEAVTMVSGQSVQAETEDLNNSETPKENNEENNPEAQDQPQETKTLADYVNMVGDQSELMGEDALSESNPSKEVVTNATKKETSQEGNNEENNTDNVKLNVAGMDLDEKLQAYLNKNVDFQEFIDGITNNVGIVFFQNNDTMAACDNADNKIATSNDNINQAIDKINGDDEDEDKDEDKNGDFGSISSSNAVASGAVASSSLKSITSDTKSDIKDTQKTTKEAEKDEDKIEKQQKIVLKQFNKILKKIEKETKRMNQAREQQDILSAEFMALETANSALVTEITASQQQSSGPAATSNNNNAQGGLISSSNSVISSGSSQSGDVENKITTVTSNQTRMNEISTKFRTLDSKINRGRRSVIKLSRNAKVRRKQFEKLAKEKIKIQQAAQKAEEAKVQKMQKQLATTEIFNTVGSIISAIGTILLAMPWTAAFGAILVKIGVGVIVLAGIAKSVILIENGYLKEGLITIGTTIATAALSMVGAGAAAGEIGGAASNTMSIVSAGANLVSSSASLVNNIRAAQGKEQLGGLSILSSSMGIVSAGANLGNAANSLQKVGQAMQIAGSVMSVSGQISQMSNGGKATGFSNTMTLIGNITSAAGALTGSVGGLTGGWGDLSGFGKVTQITNLVGQVTSTIAQISTLVKQAQGKSAGEFEQIMSIIGSSLTMVSSLMSMGESIKKGIETKKEKKKAEKKAEAERLKEKTGIKKTNKTDDKTDKTNNNNSNKSEGTGTEKKKTDENKQPTKTDNDNKTDKTNNNDNKKSEKTDNEKTKTDENKQPAKTDNDNKTDKINNDDNKKSEKTDDETKVDKKKDAAENKSDEKKDSKESDNTTTTKTTTNTNKTETGIITKKDNDEEQPVTNPNPQTRNDEQINADNTVRQNSEDENAKKVEELKVAQKQKKEEEVKKEEAKKEEVKKEEVKKEQPKEENKDNVTVNGTKFTITKDGEYKINDKVVNAKEFEKEYDNSKAIETIKARKADDKNPSTETPSKQDIKKEIETQNQVTKVKDVTGVSETSPKTVNNSKFAVQKNTKTGEVTYTVDGKSVSADEFLSQYKKATNKQTKINLQQAKEAAKAEKKANKDLEKEDKKIDAQNEYNNLKAEQNKEFDEKLKPLQETVNAAQQGLQTLSTVLSLVGTGSDTANETTSKTSSVEKFDFQKTNALLKRIKKRRLAQANYIRR